MGICEELERSARSLCGELGWRVPEPFPHENRTSSEQTLAGIDPQILETLRDCSRLDAELYAYGVSLFHARAKKDGASPDAAPVEANRLVAFPMPYVPGRRAAIQTVSARWSPGEGSHLLELAVTFRATAQIADLDLGVQVNDAAGKVVWGTSISRENVALNYQADRDLLATFLVQCELPCGIYFVTAALSEPRRLGFHDHWIDHAASFEVTPPRAAASRYVRGMMLREFRSNGGEGGS